MTPILNQTHPPLKNGGLRQDIAGIDTEAANINITFIPLGTDTLYNFNQIIYLSRGRVCRNQRHGNPNQTAYAREIQEADRLDMVSQRSKSQVCQCLLFHILVLISLILNGSFLGDFCKHCTYGYF